MLPDCFLFLFFFFLLSLRSSNVCVARLAGQAAPSQEDGGAGLGSVLTVTLAAGGAVVVDLRPPAVRGDDPRGGSPLLQGVRRFDSLFDFLSRAGAVRLR